VAINPQTLFDEAKCYLCFEISEDEALELALLARIAGGGTPALLPANVLTLDTVNTVQGNAVLTWTNPAGGADTFEIWRQLSGLNAVSGVVVSTPFTLIATVAGGLLTYTDPLTLPTDSPAGIADYQIRYKKSGVNSAFSNTVGWLHLYNPFTFTGGFATLSLPNLKKVTRQLEMIFPVTCTTVSIPLLERVGGIGDPDIGPGVNRLAVTGAGITSIDLSSLSDIAFSAAYSSGLSLSVPALVNLTLPKLVSVGGSTSISVFSGIAHWSSPLLATTEGDMDFSTNPNIISVSCPVYQFNGEFLNFNGCGALTSLSFPALVTVVDQIRFDNCPNLTSVSFPALTTISNTGINAILPCNCPLLTSASFPVLVYQNLIYDFDSCALNAASINAILHQAVASGPTAATFNLNSPGNAAPSGAGVADKATLIGLGNTVNTN
jgi:hypothetical protein